MHWFLRRIKRFTKEQAFESWIKNKLNRLEKRIMATKEEVLAAIAAEKAEVSGKLTELETLIQQLKDQIAAGDGVTPADLDEIMSAVNDIFVG